MIDRTYPLSELPAALHQIEGGHTRGKIVITVYPLGGGANHLPSAARAAIAGTTAERGQPLRTSGSPSSGR